MPDICTSSMCRSDILNPPSFQNRMRNGTITHEDIDWLNERFLQRETIKLPSSEKLRFACNTNEQRNTERLLFLGAHLIQQCLVLGKQCRGKYDSTAE